MGVFLRWGVFGIVAVAALLYAYNASKRLSERRSSPGVSAKAEEASADDEDFETEEPSQDDADAQDLIAPGAADDEDGLELSEACAEEQRVAERALKMRRDGEALDRLLRIDLIVLQRDDLRRERLAAVAKAWYERPGRDPNAATLRTEVLRDCRRAAVASPAP